jgi:hypothetical protein
MSDVTLAGRPSRISATTIPRTAKTAAAPKPAWYASVSAGSCGLLMASMWVSATLVQIVTPGAAPTSNDVLTSPAASPHGVLADHDADDRGHGHHRGRCPEPHGRPSEHSCTYDVRVISIPSTVMPAVSMTRFAADQDARAQCLEWHEGSGRAGLDEDEQRGQGSNGDEQRDGSPARPARVGDRDDRVHQQRKCRRDREGTRGVDGRGTLGHPGLA